MKQNKIIAAVGSDDRARAEMLKKIIVRLGFARIPSDAAKLIAPSIYDVDSDEAYFVFADNYNFRESPITTQRLFQAAARGIAVVVGCKKLPPEFEPFCEAYFN